MVLLVFWALLAVASVSLCSVLETTLFSVRLSALIERKAAGSTGAATLLDIKSNRIEDAIGAILTFNTVTHTFGTTLAGAQAAKLFGSLQVGLVSAALMLCLLIFSEIVPKTLAARYTGALSGITGHVLWYLVPIMRPVIFVTGAMIRLLARRPRERFTRREFAILVGRAPHDGALSLAEASLIGSLIYSREVTLSDVMIPLSMVFMLDTDQTIAHLLDVAESNAFSRIPLFRGTRQQVVGYISHRDVLKSYARKPVRDCTLERFVRPIPKLTAQLPVGRGLEQLLEQRDSIAVVTDGAGAPIGIITVEDLLEALLGMEITDEAEAVEKLRPAIARSRKHRGVKLRQRRAGQVPIPEQRDPAEPGVTHT